MENEQTGVVTHFDSFLINDYPEQARKAVNNREARDRIHEMHPGVTVQTKGQYYPRGEKLPPGAQPLFIEITGPTKN